LTWVIITSFVHIANVYVWGQSFGDFLFPYFFIAKIDPYSNFWIQFYSICICVHIILFVSKCSLAINVLLIFDCWQFFSFYHFVFIYIDQPCPDDVPVDTVVAHDSSLPNYSHEHLPSAPLYTATNNERVLIYITIYVATLYMINSWIYEMQICLFLNNYMYIYYCIYSYYA